MEMHRYFIIVLIALFLILIFKTIIGIKMRVGNVIGIIPVNKFIFIMGKISGFLVAAFMFFTAIFYDTFFRLPLNIFHSVPLFLAWISVALTIVSLIIVYISFNNLGNSNKFALPNNEQMELKTCGIYRFSRNPMYVGLALVCIASCVYFPHPINIALAFICIWIHHKVILSEERFLEKAFGEKYMEYKKKVRRYI